MEKYLALFFKSDYSNKPVLKEWQIREGKQVQTGDTLFTYGEGASQKKFTSKVSGTFKVFLWKEGQALEAGCEVAVLQVEEKIAAKSVKDGWGKAITPEEVKTGMSYAEAASIRLPKGV
jgi:hypothetical protein